MSMYPFHKLSAHAGRIRTAQFALSFQSVSSDLESLPSGYGFGLQLSWKKLSRAV